MCRTWVKFARLLAVYKLRSFLEMIEQNFEIAMCIGPSVTPTFERRGRF